MRDYLGEGENVNAGVVTLGVGASAAAVDSGYSNSVPFPNGPGNGLLLHPMWLQQANGHLRGKIRGILAVLQRQTLGDLEMVSDVPGLPGRKVLMVRVATPSTSAATGSFGFDITGPWGS